MSSDKNQVKTIKVKLLRPHQHAGMQYDVGMDIEVSEHDANWLKNLKIAEDVKNTSVFQKIAEEK